MLKIEDKEVIITNPQKKLWEVPPLTKLDYINYLVRIAPNLLAYSRDRLLTMIRWPHGVGGKSFYQKEIPAYAPTWIPRTFFHDKNWILLNDTATLVWVANQAALELHLPFNYYYQEENPSELVFDLDPMDEDNFDLVREVALKTKEVLDNFGLTSIVKTSGATGLQIYVPLLPKYSYEEIRMISEFIARYIASKNPQMVTLERMVNKRGKLLYFDYLQLWRGRTLPAPYSVRARLGAPVSAPLEWQEVEKRIKPADYTVLSLPERLEKKGDLFRPVVSKEQRQDVKEILNFLKKNLSVV